MRASHDSIVAAAPLCTTPQTSHSTTSYCAANSEKWRVNGGETIIASVRMHQRFAFGRALQRLGPHWTRRGEQATLTELDVAVDKFDDGVVVLDALGNDVDFETDQEIREIGRIALGC